MKWFEEKTSTLRMDDAKPTIKIFNNVAKKLVFYEMLFHDAWMKQCTSIFDALEAPLLTIRGNIRQELVLNFDPFFRQITEETEIIRKLDLEVPDIAQVVYYKQEKLFVVYETMKGLLERFLTTKLKIPQDLVGLMRPVMKKVERAFMPGSSSVNWTSTQLDEYFNYIRAHLNEFENVLDNVNTILTTRINQYLYDIAHTMMIDFPEERPLTVEEFMEKIRTYGFIVAKELEYKSRLMESAVTEMINLLLDTAEYYFDDVVVHSWLHPKANPVIEPKGNKKERRIVKHIPQNLDKIVFFIRLFRNQTAYIWSRNRGLCSFHERGIIARSRGMPPCFCILSK